MPDNEEPKLETIRLSASSCGSKSVPPAAWPRSGLPFPVIAAVHGAASGGGISLALAADIRLAAPAARFNAAFVRLGI